MKSIFALLLVLGVALVSASSSSDKSKLIWAMSPCGQCEVFETKCEFNKANLTRKPPLKIVCKEECQKCCPTMCPKLFKPVWGLRNGKIKDFPNACMMSSHICTTGKFYTLMEPKISC